MTRSLYSYTQDMLELIDMLDSAEDVEAVQDTLGSIEELADDKIEGLLQYRDELIALATAQKEKAKQLSEAALLKQNKANDIESYIEGTLKVLNIKEKRVGVYKLNFRKGSKSTVVDEKLLPAKYWIEQPKKAFGKKELKELIDAGETIAGVTIVQGQPSLQIKF